ncbi:hypothetical protein NDU88_007016 [Pleurodeles waltl]|uniref:Reverse transcriptase domain-containing protein n=1 Tax=Pleurodeles waltl TaxID=8319 RepID=A0AAV7RRS3_PLEWA|nr:hypothetical protein NDU88_007016 [Pleurodeles waltl]
MSPLANIVRKHDIIITSYADDTQLILSLTKDPASAKTNLQEGMKDVADWMRLSRLKLNSEKTEVLILGNTPSAWDDSWWPTALGTAPTPADHARNLGFILDPLLTMTKQVNAVSSACFLTLRMLRRDLPLDPRRHQKNRDPRPRHEPPGLRQHPLRWDHRQTPKSPATHSKRLSLPHPRRSSQQPHLRTPETPALAPSQQKDHLPTSHPRTQSPPRQGTGIPQQTSQPLRPHPPPPLLWPRTRRRPSHPTLHGGWEIFLLPGGQDLELPPHQPQDHPGPLRFPETPKDLAVRAAITTPFVPSALRPARVSSALYKC